MGDVTKARAGWRVMARGVLLPLAVQMSGCTKAALQARGLDVKQGKVKRVFTC